MGMMDVYYMFEDMFEMINVLGVVEVIDFSEKLFDKIVVNLEFFIFFVVCFWLWLN